MKFKFRFFFLFFLSISQYHIYTVAHTLCMPGNRALYTYEICFKSNAHASFRNKSKTASYQLRIDLCVLQFFLEILVNLNEKFASKRHQHATRRQVLTTEVPKRCTLLHQFVSFTGPHSYQQTKSDNRHLTPFLNQNSSCSLTELLYHSIYKVAHEHTRYIIQN